MIILQGQNLARLFGAQVLFSGVSIQIQERSRIALVGRNGTGKSTLLKMLAGLENPDQGTISKTKNLRIGYLDQQAALDTQNSIWEEMLSVFADTIKLHQAVNAAALALTDQSLMADERAYAEALKTYEALQHQLEESDGYRYESDIRSVLHGFRFGDMDYDRPIHTLSGGQKTRLALAKILLEKHDLLILDEPTNHLDIDTLAWLETYLTNYGGALLIVSHDRYFLDKVVTEVYEMSHQKIDYFKGNYSAYVAERAVRLESAWKQYDKQQVEIAKLEDFVARNLVRASTTKRAQSRRKQLEKMVKIEKPQGHEKSANFQFFGKEESGNVVLQTQDLAVGYDEKPLAKDLNLDLRKQEALALVGPNGVGKSTLLKTLIGLLPPLEGAFKWGSKVSLGYYDQEQKELNPRKDVLHELWDAFPTTSEKDIRSILGSFLFSGEDVLKPVANLSGGERARVLLAKLAMQEDNCLILDEPTNHLDLDSKEVLENALIDFDGTLIFVSHDRYFINRIATQILELTPEGGRLYKGDYDYYVEKRAEHKEGSALPQTASSPSNQKQDYTTSKDQQRQKRQLERTLAQLEAEMEDLETQIGALEERLSQPDIFSDHEQAQALSEELDSLRQTYEDTLANWEETALALEAFI